jgi:DNA-binding transcriptional LysR family regulator
MHSMNLEDLRYFLALTRYGTLSLAAKRLGVEHTTIRRRASALERSLGARLFDKTAQGWALTSKGQRLLPYAQRIESESDNAHATVTDRKHSPTGTVRIVASDGFGSSVIAPGLARLRNTHAGIDVEMVTTQELLRYGVGEFDIAVTILRPERSGFKMTRLCDYDFRLYASARYLATHPSTSGPDDLATHDMAWYAESSSIYPPNCPARKTLRRPTRASCFAQPTCSALSKQRLPVSVWRCFHASWPTTTVVLSLFCAVISGCSAAFG